MLYDWFARSEGETALVWADRPSWSNRSSSPSVRHSNRMISRRQCLAVLGALSALAPRIVGAQSTGKVYRVGLVFTTTPVSEMAGSEPRHPAVKALLHGLRDLGYVEGRNLILDRRSAEGHFERFGDIVSDLIRLNTDLIIASGTPTARAVKSVTAVPIVMTAVIDPVGEGFVQSLARPGGNMTGFTLLVAPETEAKRLELLREMLPNVSRVAYLNCRETNEWELPAGESVRTAARALGITLLLAGYSRRQYADTLRSIDSARPEALFVAQSSVAFGERDALVDVATRTRLPSSFHFREAVELGGLMSYGANVADLFYRAADYVDKILRGARPADLPVELPSKFELLLNQKTAKALGIAVPPSIQMRADEVIE